jgi:hypothetical protein
MVAKKTKKEAPSAQPKHYIPLDEGRDLAKKLLATHNGIASAAAAASNITGGTITDFAKGKARVGIAMAKRLRAALAGTPMPKMNRGGKAVGAPKAAVLIAKAELFEHLYNLGQTLGGEWKFKRKAGPFWVAVLVLADVDMAGFCAIAAARGAETYAM